MVLDQWQTERGLQVEMSDKCKSTDIADPGIELNVQLLEIVEKICDC